MPLTRRELIAAAVAGVGGLVVGGGGMSLAAGKEAAPEAAPGQAQPIKWDRETDVVVAGTGIAGLPAAIEAKAAGAEVILLEANDRPGGLAFHSGGHMILGNTHIHTQEGLEDRPEWWAEDEMKAGGYRGVAEVIKAYSTEGDKTMRWFEKLGIVYQVSTPELKRSWSSPENQRVNRSFRALGGQPNYPGGFPASAGISLITVLLREVERQRTPILLKHRMTRIYRPDRSGPVTGVEVSTPRGTINIKARRGVVLATGGWVDNEQLVKAWDPRIVDAYPGAGDFFSDMHPYIRGMGDGLLAAQAIGASAHDLSFVSYVYLRGGTTKYAVWTKPRNMESNTTGGSGVFGNWDGNTWQRVVAVKGDGRRYVNEELSVERVLGSDQWVTYERSPFVEAFLNNNPPGKAINAWAISDREGATTLRWPVDFMRNPDPQEAPGLEPGYVAVADSIQQLAAMMKIPADALQQTINRYNGFVDAGKDEDFGKPMPFYKITTPPFYAARIVGIRHTQRNGLRINSKVQVLDLSDNWDSQAPKSVDQEQVIPRLYAAGEVSNAIGWRRDHGTLGIYAILGRFAGQNVAAETPGL